ncbi:hypothetical protein VPNG_10401 [Cytospora leucostoma]|uniref:Biogenesis of lysosome-related organelles complex 1 subunit 1 n=1 Tax=Cytospora leucostoma TaxID=1230097 RepID=A0A423V7T2_9PEZI|nr:hypothetical protein VPNG_10401 [Cytospora leucostoma]
MSASIRPISPPQPSSASVTTTTVSSSSPPTTSRSNGEAHPSSNNGGPPPPPTTTTTTSSSSNNNSNNPPLPSPTNPSHLPTQSQQAQISQARAALVASIGNMLDHELQTRAGLLHANQAAIERQERDVARALGSLRREDDRLMRLLAGGSREVKELGDVQNWAERMERDFLVLEETMRLVDVDGENGDVLLDGGGGETAKNKKGKGRQVDISSSSSAAMDIDPMQIPLPLDDHDIVEGTHPTPPSGHSTAAVQPSTGATGWLRRMVWRK